MSADCGKLATHDVSVDEALRALRARRERQAVEMQALRAGLRELSKRLSELREPKE